jgi:carbamate kinase
MLEQELDEVLQNTQQIATLLTQIKVDPNDPAFKQPSKPIGPVYTKEDADRLARERGWTIAPDNDAYRRVVASPLPKYICEIRVIEMLVDMGVLVICAGGGGIPIVKRSDGSLIGVEAVIDKDRAGALLAEELRARAYVILTDVNAVSINWGKPDERAIRKATPDAIEQFTFASGSMGPKVAAACDFVRKTHGTAAIGALEDAAALLRGEAGTIITMDAAGIEYTPGNRPARNQDAIHGWLHRIIWLRQDLHRTAFQGFGAYYARSTHTTGNTDPFWRRESRDAHNPAENAV